MILLLSARATRAAVLFALLVTISAGAEDASAQSYIYGVGSYATSVSGFSSGAVAVADLNGDGQPDLALTNNDSVSVFLSQPNGSLAAPITYAVGSDPTSIVSAYLNGDGHPDLAVLNAGSNNISVLINNGDGTFQSAVNYAVGFGASNVVAADFNADNKIDLAVANGGDNTVSVLLGNGDGTFQAQIVVPVGLGPFSLVTADFNNDGKADLAMIDALGADLTVLLSDGAGTFSRKDSAIAPPGGFMQSAGVLVVGDFNNDGNVDVVAAAAGVSLGASILLGNGDGTFQTPLNAPVGDTWALAAADVNQDGKLDLVALDAGGVNGFGTFLGNGDGTFQQPFPAWLANNSADVVTGAVLADMNGDGRLDLVVPWPTLYIAFGNGNGTFSSEALPSLGTSDAPTTAVTADFNGDGKPDIAMALAGQPDQDQPSVISVVLSNGNGTFQSPVLTNLPGGTLGVLVSGDFNGDGKADLAQSISGNVSTLSVLLGNGDATFQTPISLNLPSSAAPLAAGDFNSDGETDLAVSSLDTLTASTSVQIFLSNGDGTFTPGSQVDIAPQPATLGAMTAADFNQDGKLDLAVASGTTLYIFLGNGNGTFSTTATYSVPVTSIQELVTGDFNGDGKLDLALSGQGAAVLLGNGNGTFGAPILITGPITGTPVVAGDFNNDGKLDLADGFALLLGNGDGTFTQSLAPIAGVVSALVAADFNSDGVPDLAAGGNDNGSGIFSTSAVVYLSAPMANLAPSPLTFGQFQVGQSSPPQTVTLTNLTNFPMSNFSVTATGDFSQTNNCTGTLKLSQSCQITVTFGPTEGGARTGAVTIADNAVPSPQIVGLTGTGQGPAASPSPTSLTFASQFVGTVSPVQVVTLTNTGNASLTFTNGAALGGTNSSDFLFCASMDVPTAVCRYAGIQDCGVTMSLDPGGSCTIGLAFDPAAAGTRVATLSFTDNAGGSPQVVPLTGTGMAPAPVVSLSPPNLSFPAQEVGTSSPIAKVTLTNKGTAALSITSIAASGDFSLPITLVGPCKGSIAAGASCTISVIFTPKAAGVLTGSLTVTDNAPASPQALALAGTGTEPAVALAPGSLAFPAELSGQSSSAHALSLTNSGAAPLAISGISFSGTDAGDFSQQNNCGSSLAAGATCTINVTFKPAAGGARSATLSVTDNATGSPQTVALSGTGDDFSVAPVGSSSATVAAGSTATYQVTVGNGGLTGTVALACTGAPTASTCTVSPASVAVNPLLGVHSPTVTVSVTTTARSLAFQRWPSGPPAVGQLSRLGSLALLLVLAGVAGLIGTRRRAWRLSLALSLLSLVMLIAACGGGGMSSTPTPATGTPAGNYTLSVAGTFTSGSVSLTHSTSLMLTVQ